MSKSITKIDIDAGHVTLDDYMHKPAHLKAINVARGSFAKKKDKFDASDEKLLRWLSKEKHTSPFRHSPITLHVRCPEMIARQWYKHIVGSDYTFKDTGWNEVSGRYIRYSDIYVPTELHSQAANKKQGASEEVHKHNTEYVLEWTMLKEQLMRFYNKMIDSGVANEEARAILPMGLYTEFYWTASPQALHHFVSLRTAKDAQGLMQKYASAVNAICYSHYGVLWEALAGEVGE
jgi:thymidylate synthase (FAD)